jgi:hypothetical protein
MFKAKGANVKLYYAKKKLHFDDDDDVHFVLDQHA